MSNGLPNHAPRTSEQNCAKTWDLCLDIIKTGSLGVAIPMDPDFVSYLKGFEAMRAGYASGNFVYGLFVASAISK